MRVALIDDGVVPQVVPRLPARNDLCVLEDGTIRQRRQDEHDQRHADEGEHLPGRGAVLTLPLIFPAHIFSPFCNGRAVFNLLIDIYKKASASF